MTISVNVDRDQFINIIPKNKAKSLQKLREFYNDFAIASISLLFIYYMQEQRKLLKKSSKSAKYDKNKQAFKKIKDMEDLLKIDFIQIPQRKPHVHQFYNPSSQDTARKSHKSLAVNIERIERLAKEKPITNVSEHLPPRAPKRKASKMQVKEAVKTIDIETEKQEESKQATSHEFQYVEKKLKVGKKNKSNAMKDFILETLNRAKAEGTCLVIHKGTAQSSFSPISKNKSQTSKHQKEQFPLILVQDNNAEREKKPTKSIFAANSKKITKNASSKSTAINLPSVNKKWVKMAKEFQEKNGKRQSKAEIIEVIEEKIQAVQESAVFEKQEEIIEQIIPQRNDSIVRQ